WTVDLRADEVLTAVRFPVWAGRSGFAVEEIARRHGDFAIAGVACAVTVGHGDVVTRAAVALFGVAPTPVRTVRMEAELVSQEAHRVDCGALGAVAADALHPLDDVHASGAYRRAVAATLVERALSRAIEEARHARER